MSYETIQADMTEPLPFDDETFNAVLCDPPYGISFLGKGWDHGVPGADTWAEVLRVCRPGAVLMAFGGRRTWHRLAVALEDAGWEIFDTAMWIYGKSFAKSLNIHKAIGGENDWDGYGTSLKANWEPIILARKPREGTYANTALKYGSGPLNIDGGRLPLEDGLNMEARQRRNNIGGGGYKPGVSGETIETDIKTYKAAGRWPSNLLLDTATAPLLGDKARFFYATKSSRKEKSIGLTPPATNHHPTVKPIDLCRYLATLLLPPTDDATLFVPFAGSGSEQIGAILAGWPNVVGVELNDAYLPINRQRVAWWAQAYAETGESDPKALTKR